MATAIEKLKNLTIGHVKLGKHGETTGSVKQQVHDGDTVSVEALGNFGIRFLGIDAPEVSFMLPGKTTFTSIGDPKWAEFLTDPLAATWDPFKPAMEQGLADYLRGRVGPTCAANHSDHAQVAQDTLEDMITADIEALGKNKETFAFFLVFAYEITDGYGRLLCFINCDKKDKPRPVSYNERLLQTGVVSPYFIWPNIDPYRAKGGYDDAVPDPGTAADTANKGNLGDARQWVKDARANGLGIFNPANPLMLESFELRYLSRRAPQCRWVIDLSKNDNVLVKPQNYCTIPYSEDRLFLDNHHVPLFEKHGWVRES